MSKCTCYLILVLSSFVISSSWIQVKGQALAIGIDSSYVYNAEGGRIPDFVGEAKAVAFPVEVSGVPTTSDIGLVKACFSIAHRRTSDIKVELMAPDGTTIWLTNRNGGLEGRNYNATCFSATGFSGYIHQAEAPFEGDYIPDGRLEFLNVGQPNGQWTLLVYDLAEGVEGYLTRVNLSFGTLPLRRGAPCEENSDTNCSCPNASQSTCDLLPDLVLLDAFTSSTLKTFPSDHPVYPNQLRFSVSIANVGDGPFEVVIDEDAVGDHPDRNLFQTIYKLNEGALSTTQKDGGVIYYDDSPGHDHYHVDDWVAFKLYRVSRFLFWSIRSEVATARKVSFCLFDSGICDGLTELCDVEGTIYGPKNLTNYGMGSYMSCGDQRQGISVGGYDTYGYSYEGQYISLPDNLAAGLYELEVTIDPLGRYQELDKSNNTAVFTIDLR